MSLLALRPWAVIVVPHPRVRVPRKARMGVLQVQPFDSVIDQAADEIDGVLEGYKRVISEGRKDLLPVVESYDLEWAAKVVRPLPWFCRSSRGALTCRGNRSSKTHRNLLFMSFIVVEAKGPLCDDSAALPLMS